MKTKQIIGVVATGLVIIVTGIIGVATNIVSNKLTQKQEPSSSFWSGFENTVVLPEEDFVAQLNIEGEIGPTQESVWGSESVYDHNLYMNYVDELMDSKYNKGIMLYIDSPGGTVYESDELYLKLMEYKEKTGRPIWAYMGSQACSGGYYIAMAADKIYANRNCWTGSIGVIVSLVNCKELYDKLGIKEIDITSGENKAMGSSGLDLTKEQQEILQSLVDEAYDQFVGVVADGRSMDDKTVRQLADGRIYSAKQAKDANLIDEIGLYEDVKDAFSEQLHVSPDVLYDEPVLDDLGIFSTLFSVLRDLKPESELDFATDIVENRGNGVLKYYAK